MNFTIRMRGLVKTMAVVLSLAMPLMLAVSGCRRPRRRRQQLGLARHAHLLGAAEHVHRAERGAAVQPHHDAAGLARHDGPAAGAAAKGGFFNRPGMGMLGGLAAGFLGAGLLGMLFGGGLFCGLGGISSIIGLLLQVGLVIIVVRLAMSWWQRRNASQTASAYAGRGQRTWTSGPGQTCPDATRAPEPVSASAPTPRSRSKSCPADYEAFEKLLGDVQTAWSNEDVEKLAHPGDAGNGVVLHHGPRESKAERGVVNKVIERQAAAGRPRGSLARRRDRLRQRGDALRAGRQDDRARQRQRWSTAARRRSKPPRVWTFVRAARRQLGTVGDPAGLSLAGRSN